MKKNRENLVKEFYELNQEDFEKVKDLANSPRPFHFTEEFKRQTKFYKVNPIITRTMMNYDRYWECDNIMEFINKHQIDLKQLKILDFGSGVGDYGIFMARKGAKVTFCDFPELIDFVSFRCKKENLSHESIMVSTDDEVMDKIRTCNFDLAICGEVLEHIKNPLGLLQSLKNAKFIFTSAYPFKSKESFNDPGHLYDAFLQQEKCLDFLNDNYKCEAVLGVAKMWHK